MKMGIYIDKTLDEVVNELVEIGYATDFNVPENVADSGLRVDSLQLESTDFQIDHVYTFYEIDQARNMYIFAISSHQYNVKGIAINSLTDNPLISLSEIALNLKRRIRGLLKNWQLNAIGFI